MNLLFLEKPDPKCRECSLSPNLPAAPRCIEWVAMKTIDIKSAIIGFLLCTVLFLSTGLANNNAAIDVRIIEIDKKFGGSWDTIKVGN